jgi:hypothetical protein
MCSGVQSNGEEGGEVDVKMQYTFRFYENEGCHKPIRIVAFAYSVDSVTKDLFNVFFVPYRLQIFEQKSTQ